MRVNRGPELHTNAVDDSVDMEKLCEKLHAEVMRMDQLTLDMKENFGKLTAEAERLFLGSWDIVLKKFHLHHLQFDLERVHALSSDMFHLTGALYNVHDWNLEDCKKKATSCWVEVYDEHPAEETAVRLRCGYIREADDELFSRLDMLLPLEEWDTVYCCRPGAYLSCTKLLDTSQHRTDDKRHELVLNWVQKTLGALKLTHNKNHELIFHDDARVAWSRERHYKQQLVIVKRKNLTKKIFLTPFRKNVI